MKKLRIKEIHFLMLLFAIIIATSCKKKDEPEKEKYITLTYPNGGDIFNLNAVYSIRWESNIPDDITILLYKNNCLADTIKRNVINNGLYDWKVPSGYIPDSTFKIRVVSVSDTNICDYSDNVFRIRSTIPVIPWIRVTSPNGGEIFQMGTYHWITWERNFSGLVKIYLLIDGYLWGEVPGNGTTENSMHVYFPSGFPTDAGYRILVAESSNIQLNDISDEDFFLTE